MRQLFFTSSSLGFYPNPDDHTAFPPLKSPCYVYSVVFILSFSCPGALALCMVLLFQPWRKCTGTWNLFLTSFCTLDIVPSLRFNVYSVRQHSVHTEGWDDECMYFCWFCLSDTQRKSMVVLASAVIPIKTCVHFLFFKKPPLILLYTVTLMNCLQSDLISSVSAFHPNFQCLFFVAIAICGAIFVLLTLREPAVFKRKHCVAVFSWY